MNQNKIKYKILMNLNNLFELSNLIFQNLIEINLK